MQVRCDNTVEESRSDFNTLFSSSSLQRQSLLSRRRGKRNCGQNCKTRLAASAGHLVLTRRSMTHAPMHRCLWHRTTPNSNRKRSTEKLIHRPIQRFMQRNGSVRSALTSPLSPPDGISILPIAVAQPEAHLGLLSGSGMPTSRCPAWS